MLTIIPPVLSTDRTDVGTRRPPEDRARPSSPDIEHIMAEPSNSKINASTKGCDSSISSMAVTAKQELSICPTNGLAEKSNQEPLPVMPHASSRQEVCGNIKLEPDDVASFKLSSVPSAPSTEHPARMNCPPFLAGIGYPFPNPPPYIQGPPNNEQANRKRKLELAPGRENEMFQRPSGSAQGTQRPQDYRKPADYLNSSSIAASRSDHFRPSAIAAQMCAQQLRSQNTKADVQIKVELVPLVHHISPLPKERPDLRLDVSYCTREEAFRAQFMAFLLCETSPGASVLFSVVMKTVNNIHPVVRYMRICNGPSNPNSKIFVADGRNGFHLLTVGNNSTRNARCLFEIQNMGETFMAEKDGIYNGKQSSANSQPLGTKLPKENLALDDPQHAPYKCEDEEAKRRRLDDEVIYRWLGPGATTRMGLT
ncbi:hypothetical protein PVAG01_04714 [Phlyctema vagabunda]|uniref:Uncharacterized protein n=1 Tax=Phlyctema vagabunda TaxID=108571 RepID=A0ABR4PHZ5_9HELO